MVGDLPESGGEQLPDPPQVDHKSVTLTQRDSRARTRELTIPHFTAHFDGGAAKKSGFGGLVVWDPSGRVVVARAIFFGEDAPTNNVAEMLALEQAASLA